MSNRTFRSFQGATLAAALLCAPVAFADSPSATPVMQKAFAKLEQGPDQLRWFVQRTRMIYALNVAEVVAAYEATRTADATAPVADPVVASVRPEVR